MTIKASINGQFLLPPNMELVSGIYWIKFPGHFSKPVTLSIQHCCDLESPDQASSLCFVTAKCRQEPMPYKFQKMSEKGYFSTESSYGTIQVQHFCGVGIAQQRNPEELAKEKWNKRYLAQAFYLAKDATPYQRDVHIPVIWDLELHRKVIFCALYT